MHPLGRGRGKSTPRSGRMKLDLPVGFLDAEVGRWVLILIVDYGVCSVEAEEYPKSITLGVKRKDGSYKNDANCLL